MTRRVIISTPRDMGSALGRERPSAGHEVAGTYRTRTENVDEPKKAGPFYRGAG